MTTSFQEVAETTGYAVCLRTTWTGVPQTAFWLQPLAHKRVLGVPHGCRARGALFTTMTLQAKTTKYPSVGQHKVSGAASAMMVHFAAFMSGKIQLEHPADVHRPRGFCSNMIMTPIVSNPLPTGGSQSALVRWQRTRLCSLCMGVAY